MFKIYKSQFSMLSVMLLTMFVVFSCSKKEDERTYWDAVEFTTSNNSFAFLITSSIIPPAGDYGLPVMENVANGGITGLDKERFYYMSLYPQVLDPMYKPFAEKFLFRYDESGDDTFENYPSFVNNLKNFSYELDDFNADVIAHQNSPTSVKVGNLVRANNGILTMYVKLQYVGSFSENHSVAVYLYEKELIASQETIASGEVSNFIHRNVFSSSVTSQYGDPISGTFESGHETELSFIHDYGTEDITNLGILTVVYKLDSSNEPVGVYTVYRN
ncbi:MAG: hypothetical protein ACJA0Q_000341 [Saprospiraceae bacterium]|jgi:hypothetical protein